MLSGSAIGQLVMFTFSYDGFSFILKNMSQYNCKNSYEHSAVSKSLMPCKLTVSHTVGSYPCASISTL